MTRKGCYKLAIGLLAVGLVVICFSSWSGHPRVNSPQRLPDGSVVTLVQAEFGRADVSLDGSFMARMRRRWVPAAGLKVMGQQWIAPLVVGTNFNGFRSYRSQFVEGDLVFALRHDDLPVLATVPRGRALGRLSSEWTRNLRATVFDERGNELPVPVPRGFGFHRQAMSANAMSFWPVPAFPREGKMVGLRLHQKSATNGWRSVAEFTIPNPVPASRRTLTVEPMPAVRRMGELEFTLLNFEAGECPEGLGRAVVGRNARATVRVNHNGQPSDLYVLRKVRLADAMGNEYRCFLASLSTNGVYDLEGFLDPRQPWIVKMEFGRTRDFPPEALAVVPVKRIDQAVSRSTGTFSTNAHGHKIKTLMWASQLEVTFPEATNGCFATLVSARAEDGRLLSTGKFTVTYPLAGTVIPVVQEEDRAELTFAIEKGITVEYVVRPTIVEVTKDSQTLPER